MSTISAKPLHDGGRRVSTARLPLNAAARALTASRVTCEVPLDGLFLGGGWIRLAVGDGGNEIGMGKLPRRLIGETVPNGEAIASMTSCDHLVVAGVSNWGAYGLMAALAVLKPEWRDAIAKFLTAERDLAVTNATVAAGAVDGVTARREPTVDGFGADVHGRVVEKLRRIAYGEAAD